MTLCSSTSLLTSSYSSSSSSYISKDLMLCYLLRVFRILYCRWYSLSGTKPKETTPVVELGFSLRKADRNRPSYFAFVVMDCMRSYVFPCLSSITLFHRCTKWCAISMTAAPSTQTPVSWKGIRASFTLSRVQNVWSSVFVTAFFFSLQ